MRKFRGRLPRRGPLPFRYVFLLTFIFFCISTTAGLWIINEGLKPTLMSYAESQTRKIATLVINKAINKKVADGMDTSELFMTDSAGNTRFNGEIISRIQGELTNLIQKNIKEAEAGNLSILESITDVEINSEETKDDEGIVYYIPLGQATNNALLGNLGPKIPIKFNAIGSVESNPVFKSEEKGINNNLVTVEIQVKVDVQIIIPFATDIISYKQNIYVGGTYIEGDVPQFYNNGGGDANPSLELPLD